MALWMWLEHATKKYNFVHKLCVTLPDTLLNGIADESVVALNCIQHDDFHVGITNRNQGIPLLNALTKTGPMPKGSKNLKQYPFHQLYLTSPPKTISSCICTLQFIALFNEVCMRAFDDLFPKPQPNPAKQMMLNADMFRPYNPSFHNIAAITYYMVGASKMGPFPNRRMYDYLRGVFDPYDLTAQCQILNEKMGNVLSRLNLNDDQHEAEDVSADERTIFLTFSKGYPISEVEVREFFSRKFGDFIDGVFMQEVPAEKQPLYAHLVVRSTSSIPIILKGKNKAKFFINGKHVQARKYVCKSKSPGDPSSLATSI
ncbi:hypothetical protein PRUPE_2G219700 [Prunus persica]|uniref:RRM domain-containing protein n=1 Tax=Prunus persica TaxID=3760 RepID=M5XKL5_PRUPE|nr:hypothetical protein PRUPE_2G219700 [Prunus persica]